MKSLYLKLIGAFAVVAFGFGITVYGIVMFPLLSSNQIDLWTKMLYVAGFISLLFFGPATAVIFITVGAHVDKMTYVYERIVDLSSSIREEPETFTEEEANKEKEYVQSLLDENEIDETEFQIRINQIDEKTKTQKNLKQ